MHCFQETYSTRHGLRVLACLLVLLSILVVPQSAAAVSVDAVEREQVRLINEYRASQGLSRLVIDVKLTRTAEWMAGDMPRFDYFSHTDHLGRDPFQRLSHFKYPANSWRGENLAAGNEGAPETFQQWKESEGHRLNMVNRNYRAIGIARVNDPGSTYGFYWVTEFGSKITKRVPPSGSASKATKGASAAPALTPRQIARIKARARRCATVRRGTTRYRTLKCAWHVRKARQLRALGH